MKMETLSCCPVCKGEQRTPYLVCKDYTVSQEDFTLEQCQSCGFVFTNPRPTEDEIGAYYQSSDYISHSNTKQGLVAKAYHRVRKITLQSKLKLVNELSPKKGRLLDVGCGTGMFLSVCKEGGWQISGIEPDPGARQIAVEQTAENIQSSILESYAGETFQVITMWHVLEHIHQLEATLNWLKERVADQGHLVIAVPNLQSFDAQAYGKHWAAYDVPRHLYHFSQKAIQQLITEKGFTLTQTLPMPFDSFYVSMLSTKYRDGNINYVEAIRKGLQSNQWAKSHQNNYSSLIYVFKKA